MGHDPHCRHFRFSSHASAEAMSRLSLGLIRYDAGIWHHT
jgi:hypothetical protein